MSEENNNLNQNDVADTQENSETSDEGNAPFVGESSDKATPKKTATNLPDSNKNEKQSQDKTQPPRLSKEQVEQFCSYAGIPKEVKPVFDNDGNLKFVVPIDGKKFLATPEEVFKGFGLTQAGYKKLQEAKQLQKQQEELFNEFKTNPRKMFDMADKLGIDKYELAYQLLEEKVALENMTPHERKAIEEQQKRIQLEQENQQLKHEKDKREFDELTQREQQKVEQELITAMEKHGFNKANKDRKAQIISAAVGKLMLAQHYGKTLSVDDAVYLAKQEWKTGVRDVFSEVSDDHILDVMDEDVLKRIQRALVKKHERGPTPDQSSGRANFGGEHVELEELPEQNSKQRKKQTLSEFFDQL
jgi:hypothetical protein